MRQLHTFEAAGQAQSLAAALFAQGMPAVVRDAADGGHAVWVEDEEHMEGARATLAAFLENPDDPRFQRLEREAQERRRAIDREEKKTRHKVVKARSALDKPAIGRVTLGLILISIAVTLMANFGKNPITHRLWFSYMLVSTLSGVADITASLHYTYVEKHEFWRLLSPMFLHLGILHLVFNMWWLKDLGTAIEHHLSVAKLLTIVIVTQLVASVGQLVVSGPQFGGFSGVIYALFGYLWLRGRYDPSFPVRLDRSTVIIMMVWFALCFTGFMPIANTMHTIGLVMGAAWGLIDSGHIRRRLLRN